ncbi:uncharacterized protein F4812DRAFT_416441 [Daldinia caldariorum]|uniref:uncharacterized protein n=1 Tax=Daldinia caldariorum TaxID=326644 RepID=UPI0020082219|nr:uncharacterized protein F4812DRAFT_416441 [Daldinia caldariorum]KAI1472040.1 hypothetical protein F4812DRAFT_416441 [Daldinia caldariorum]
MTYSNVTLLQHQVSETVYRISSPKYLLTNMSRQSHVTRDSTSDVIYQLARVADTLHDNSLGRVDLLEKYVDHELEKRSADLKASLEKVNTTIQSLQGTANHAGGCCEGGDGMIDRLNLLQAQIQTLHADQNSFWAGFEDLRCKMAGIRSNQHDLRDVLRMMRADAQVLREPTDTFGFPQFKRLPLEVRTMIWDLAIPNRILGLAGKFGNQNKPETFSFNPHLSPPSVAHVCREARSIACRSGRLVNTIKKDSVRYSRYNGRGRKDDVNGTLRLSWYDPSRDSLRLYVNYLKWLLDVDVDICQITECIQFDIGSTDSRHIACHWLLSYLSDTHYFPRLKVVDFISGVYLYRPYKDHVLDTQLFFGPDRQNLLSLDITDKTAKKALIDRIKMNHSVEANRLVSWLEKDANDSWGDRGRDGPNLKMKWPQFLDHLQKKWIFLQSQRGYSDEVNHTEQADGSSGKLSQSCPVFG